MPELDVIRAWKDQDYRYSLTPAEQASLPDSPAGILELSDVELEQVFGGTAACQASVATECNNSNGCISAVCSAGCLFIDIDVNTNININAGNNNGNVSVTLPRRRR